MIPKTKSKKTNQRMPLIIGIVAVAAVVVAVAFAVLSSQCSSSRVSVDYAQIPQERLPDGGFVLGSADAPITVVAFEDFLCPHCQRYQSTIGRFINQYVAAGSARFEYRFLPAVDPTYSPLTAKLAECADTLRPGSFWQAHDVMFDIASAGRYNDRSSRSFAERMELSYTELLECAQDARQINVDTQLADQLGITGTPTVYVRYSGGPPQPSPFGFGKQPTFEQLSQLIDAAG